MSKHVFSAFHKQDIAAAVRARKPYLERYVKEFEAGLVDYLPFINLVKQAKISLCFGCKSCYKTPTNTQKAHACAKMKEGVGILKQLLASTSTPSASEKVSADVAALQRTIDALKRQKVVDKEMLDEAFEFQTALAEIIKLIAAKDEVLYKDVLDTFSVVGQLLDS